MVRQLLFHKFGLKLFLTIFEIVGSEFLLKGHFFHPGCIVIQLVNTKSFGVRGGPVDGLAVAMARPNVTEGLVEIMIHSFNIPRIDSN